MLLGSKIAGPWRLGALALLLLAGCSRSYPPGSPERAIDDALDRLDAIATHHLVRDGLAVRVGRLLREGGSSEELQAALAPMRKSVEAWLAEEPLLELLRQDATWDDERAAAQVVAHMVSLPVRSWTIEVTPGARPDTVDARVHIRPTGFMPTRYRLALGRDPEGAWHLTGIPEMQAGAR